MGSCNDVRISRFLQELFGLDKHAVKLPRNMHHGMDVGMVNVS